MPEPRLSPMFRIEYDPAGRFNQRYSCHTSPPKMIMCGPPSDQEVLIVKPRDSPLDSGVYSCCCPANCQQQVLYHTPPIEYGGNCHCFSGWKDVTHELCDMKYTVSFSGPAVGAPCAGPHILAESYNGFNSTCHWTVGIPVTFEANIPDVECPERCPGDDDIPIARGTPNCSVIFDMYCELNPCGKKTYLATTLVTNYYPHPCPNLRCDDGSSIPMACNAGCLFLRSWIPNDICSCPKPGTYAAYPFGSPTSWCTSPSTTPIGCDPLGPGGGGHTITIAKVHADDCKPFVCAKPPCTASV